MADWEAAPLIAKTTVDADCGVIIIGKAFAKDLLRFEVTEGLQENIQEMSGAAWKYYYAGQYNGTKYTLGQAFDKGYAEQLTKQGLRTFLQGALTGSLIRPVTHTVGKATSYLNEKATESNAIENLNEQTKFAMQEKQEVASAACQLTAYAEFKDGTVIEIVIGVIEGMTCAQFY